MSTEENKAVVRRLLDAFNQRALAIYDELIAADCVEHNLPAGTHTSAFMGIPPSGKRITASGIEMVRLAGGKQIETWVEWDALGFMQRIGALPAMGQASA